jgi:hypothetical protein
MVSLVMSSDLAKGCERCEKALSFLLIYLVIMLNSNVDQAWEINNSER